MTAYIDPDELEENMPGAVDSTHEMGISHEFYDNFGAGAGLTSARTGTQVFLEEIEFEKVDD